MNGEKAENIKKDNPTSKVDLGMFAMILTFLIAIVYIQIGMKVIFVFFISLVTGMLVNWASNTITPPKIK